MKSFRVFGYRVTLARERQRREWETVTVARPFMHVEAGVARHVAPGERVRVSGELAEQLRTVGKAEP